jgi:Cu+-exporting ATPase
MKKITLRIGGMSCSACSNGLEKHLKKQNGIIDASVNLVMQNAYIEYDDDISMDDLTKFINRAGFENLGIYKFKSENENNKKTLLLIIYGILSIIYLYISMYSLYLLPFSSKFVKAS